MGVLATSKGDQLILWVFLLGLSFWTHGLFSVGLIPSTAVVILFFFLIYLAVPGLSCSMQGF